MVDKLRYTQLDVFTTTRFLGNPLAIVHLPENFDLPHSKKLTIAKEFNLSETVFLHESSDATAPITIDIYTTTEELPFAGHPTVGSSAYLLSQAPEKDTVTLKTKAGIIPAKRDGQRVTLQVPVDFKVHEPYTNASVKTLQHDLKETDYVNGQGPEALCSIVKGMTFVLLQVASEEALARLHPYSERFMADNLGDWQGFLGIYAFYEGEDGVVRTRMFDGSLEDPATGSAASTLGGYLGKKRGCGKHRIEIIQGVEMGRKSEITVDVEIGVDDEIQAIYLGGTAVSVIEGSMRIQVN